MIEQNVQKYEVNDRVYMNEQLYKIIHIYDDGSLKLKSARGKTSETVFRVPIDFVTRA
jgi:hypothetical protein